MAHSIAHFSIGMLAASLTVFRFWRRTRRHHARLAPVFARWIVLSTGLGMAALAPSLMRRAGVPDAICSGWWMNVFFFHPWLQRTFPGQGMLPGLILVAALAGIQYSFLVVTILHRPRKPTTPTQCKEAPSL